MKTLSNDFGVDLRIIRAGRPMANGQAENAVKNVKQKMRMLCLENGCNFIFMQCHPPYLFFFFNSAQIEKN